MDTQALIARLRERAATQDACGCWSLDKVAADELERLAALVDTIEINCAEYPCCTCKKRGDCKR